MSRIDEFLAHKYSCAVAFGERCNCGYDQAIADLTALRAEHDMLMRESVGLMDTIAALRAESALISPEVIRSMEYGAEIIRKTEAEIDEAGLVHTCGDCGQKLQMVRPGKYQCDNPECPSNVDAL